MSRFILLFITGSTGFNDDYLIDPFNKIAIIGHCECPFNPSGDDRWVSYVVRNLPLWEENKGGACVQVNLPVGETVTVAKISIYDKKITLFTGETVSGEELFAGKKDLRIEERDRPVIQNPDEVLTKTQSVGICASDRMYYFSGGTVRGIPKPFTLGHECSGIIVDKGEKVKSFAIGDRVAIEPGLPCNHCEFCLSGNYNLCKSMKFMASHSFDGCLVEYLIWREDRVFKIPEKMTFDEAALMEPLSVSIF